jgi:hypothetical protein
MSTSRLEMTLSLAGKGITDPEVQSSEPEERLAREEILVVHPEVVLQIELRFGHPGGDGLCGGGQIREPVHPPDAGLESRPGQRGGGEGSKEQGKKQGGQSFHWTSFAICYNGGAVSTRKCNGAEMTTERKREIRRRRKRKEKARKRRQKETEKK